MNRLEAERAESKENPYIASSKAISSRDIMNRMFDNLVGNAEK